ncbi:MAG: Lrp/AsnC family transcriptional regulator [Actinomycetaceae bacterium]|nr:Lrp/AsnC family transcriptional regulator [Actinomycetaceae bacterium]
MANSDSSLGDTHLDDIYLAMLNELRNDSRVSIAALANKLGISRSNAYARLNALVDAHIIQRYTVDIDPNKLGKKITALVFVSLDQSAWKEFGKHLHELRELDYYAITTGSYDAMLRVRADDVPGIQRVVIEEISQWPCVRDTETVFLMHEQHFDYDLDHVSTPGTSLEALGMMGFVATAQANHPT